MEAFTKVPPEDQIKALLDVIDDLDSWTAKFVTSLSEWIASGKRLSYRQRMSLLEAFERYDPLWLKPRRRIHVWGEGKVLQVDEAIAILTDRIATLDASDALFVRRLILMTADGGRVTDRAGIRLTDVFTRAGLWRLVPYRRWDVANPAEIRAFSERWSASARIANAVAERAAMTGPLH
jgi:hypothetical protein